MTATMGAAPADKTDPAASAKRLYRTERDETPIHPIMDGLHDRDADAPRAVQRINEDEWIAESRPVVVQRVDARRGDNGEPDFLCERELGQRPITSALHRGMRKLAPTAATLPSE